MGFTETLTNFYG